MKKIIFFFTIIIISFLIISCGSIESDAEKLATLECKAVKLQQKAMSGDQSVLSESKKLIQEAASLARELAGRYNSVEDAVKFKEALDKAKQNVNCN